MRIMIHSNAPWASCYDEQTEVLSKRGWLPFEQITKRDEVMTCHPETLAMEWQNPVKLIEQRVTAKDMVKIDALSIDLLVTPNHSMFLSKIQSDGSWKWMFDRADNICGKVHNKFARIGVWKGKSPDFFILPDTDRKIPIEDWVRFIGFYLSGGHIDHNAKENGYRNYTVALNQDEPNLDKMADALHKVTPHSINYYKYRRVLTRDYPLWLYLKQFGYASDKFIPQDIKELSPYLLKIFLDAYIFGDGSRNGHRILISTSSYKMKDDLMEIAIKAGFGATSHCQYKAGMLNGLYGINKQDIWNVQLSQTRTHPVINKNKNVYSKEEYTGIVRCLEVDNHILLVRRNGKSVFCGNSGYGGQTRYLSQNLLKQGHQVAVSTFFGLQGTKMEANGISVYPIGLDGWGNDIIDSHVENFGADIVISLIDVWVLTNFGGKLPNKWCAWFPIDGEPMPDTFKASLEGSIRAITMNEWSAKEAIKGGVKNVICIPHGVDTDVFRPLATSRAESRKIARDALKIPQETFLAIMVAANQSYPDRKAFTEQIEAFARFNKDHPDSLLYVHSDVLPNRGGIDLHLLCKLLGAENIVKFPKRYDYHLGFSDEEMCKLYNAADVLLSASSGEGFCCLPGTKIYTDSGIKKVEDIPLSSKLITHNGKQSKILKSMQREYSGKVVDIRTWGTFEDISLTADHPILAVKWLDYRNYARRGETESSSCPEPGWYKASELNKGDIVMFPIPREQPQVSRFDLVEMLGVQQYDNEFVWDKTVYSPKTKTVSKLKIPRYVELNQDLAILLGWYIAEGDCGNLRTVGFSLYGDEEKESQEIVELMSKVFGIEVLTIRGSNSIELRCSSKVLAMFFSKLCGKGARNKHIPKEFMFGKSELLSLMLDRMLRGDGYIRNERRIYSTSSENLALDIRLARARFGSMSMINKYIRERYFNTDERFTSIEFTISYCGDGMHSRKTLPVSEGLIGVRIKYINYRDYTGSVFNFEAETDNTYTTSAFVVHNCIPIIEAQACGLPVITNSCGGLPELVGAGWVVPWTQREYYNLGNFHFRPSVDGIYKTLNECFDSDKEKLFQKAREFILSKYSWELLARTKWAPLMIELEEMRNNLPSKPVAATPVAEIPLIEV